MANPGLYLPDMVENLAVILLLKIIGTKEPCIYALTDGLQLFDQIKQWSLFNSNYLSCSPIKLQKNIIIKCEGGIQKDLKCP